MNQIQEILQNLEKDNHIRILYACETGSRAWGFPSPDSDYDIRFIYMHPRNGYLSLSRREDNIGFLDQEWDISGWDLRKSLLLLKKSNAPLIERFQSPIEYWSVPGFKSGFMELVEAYYSPRAVFYHHYSLARKFWEGLNNGGPFRLKDLFYAIRSLLSCQWIIRDKRVLPMDIRSLMSYADDAIARELESLIALKATVNESYLHQDSGDVLRWMSGLMEQLEEVKESPAVNNKDMKEINDFFLKMMYA